MYLNLSDQLAIDHIGKDLASPVLGTLVLTAKHKYYFDMMLLLKKPQNNNNQKTQIQQTNKQKSKAKPQTNKQTNPIFVPKISAVTRCSTGEHQELATIP